MSRIREDFAVLLHQLSEHCNHCACAAVETRIQALGTEAITLEREQRAEGGGGEATHSDDRLLVHLEGLRLPAAATYELQVGGRLLFHAVQPLTQATVAGINSLLLVLGAGTSGKSELVHGQDESKGEWNGLMEAAIESLFNALPSDALSEAENLYRVRMQFLSVYHERVIDLLPVRSIIARLEGAALPPLGHHLRARHTHRERDQG